MTMNAIAKKVVEKNGRDLMEILNCPDPDLIGIKYFAHNRASDRLPEVIVFEPQDQFCWVVNLESVSVNKS